MPQGRLYKVLQDMLSKDTGTNVHRIYVTCDLATIRTAWSMAKAEYEKSRITWRQLKVTHEAPDGYIIEIYRPPPKDPNITILK